MIFTQCCYYDKPMVVPYESGDPGAGGFTAVLCEHYGKTNVVELVSFGGVAYSEEEFKKKYIDTGKVHTVSVNNGAGEQK